MDAAYTARAESMIVDVLVKMFCTIGLTMILYLAMSMYNHQDNPSIVVISLGIYLTFAAVLIFVTALDFLCRRTGASQDSTSDLGITV